MGIRLGLFLAAFVALPVAGAHAQTAAALATSGAEIILIDIKKSKVKDTTKVKGGKVLAMDIRPFDKKLYGVTSDSKLVTISTKTGKLTVVATLSQPAPSGNLSLDISGFEGVFRLVSDKGDNLRISASTGLVSKDADVNNGAVNAEAVGVAYTNAFSGAPSSQLFAVSARDQVLCELQFPGLGTCIPVGSLGVRVKAPLAFDILTVKENNTGYAVFERKLYAVNLDSGKFGKGVAIKDLKTNVRDIAFLP